MSGSQRHPGAGDHIIDSNNTSSGDLCDRSAASVRRRNYRTDHERRGGRERRPTSRTMRDIYRRPNRTLWARHLFHDGDRAEPRKASGQLPVVVESFHSAPNVALGVREDAGRRHRRVHRRSQHHHGAKRPRGTPPPGDILSLTGSQTSRLASSAGAGDLMADGTHTKLLQVAPGITIEVSVDVPWAQSGLFGIESVATPSTIQVPDVAPLLAISGATGDSPPSRTGVDVSVGVDLERDYNGKPKMTQTDSNEMLGDPQNAHVSKEERELSNANDGTKISDVIGSLITALMKVNVSPGGGGIVRNGSRPECYVAIPEYTTEPSSPTSPAPNITSDAPASTPSQPLSTPVSPPPPPLPRTPPPFLSRLAGMSPPPGYPFPAPSTSYQHPLPYSMYGPHPVPNSCWSAQNPQGWASGCPQPTHYRRRKKVAAKSEGNSSEKDTSSRSSKVTHDVGLTPYGYPQIFSVPSSNGYPPSPIFNPGIGPMPMAYNTMPYPPQLPCSYQWQQPPPVGSPGYGWATPSFPASPPCTLSSQDEVKTTSESERVAAQVNRENDRPTRGRKFLQRSQSSSSSQSSPALNQSLKIPRSVRANASASKLSKTNEWSSSTASPSPTERPSHPMMREARRRRCSSSSELCLQANRGRNEQDRSSSSESENRLPLKKNPPRPKRVPLPPELASAWARMGYSSTLDESSSTSEKHSEKEQQSKPEEICPLATASANPGTTEATAETTEENGVQVGKDLETQPSKVPRVPTKREHRERSLTRVTDSDFHDEDDNCGWEDRRFGKRRKLEDDSAARRDSWKGRMKGIQLKEFRFMEKDLYAAWHNINQPATASDPDEADLDICTGCKTCSSSTSTSTDNSDKEQKRTFLLDQRSSSPLSSSSFSSLEGIDLHRFSSLRRDTMVLSRLAKRTDNGAPIMIHLPQEREQRLSEDRERAIHSDWGIRRNISMDHSLASVTSMRGTPLRGTPGLEYNSVSASPKSKQGGTSPTPSQDTLDFMRSTIFGNILEEIEDGRVHIRTGGSRIEYTMYTSDSEADSRKIKFGKAQQKEFRSSDSDGNDIESIDEAETYMDPYYEGGDESELGETRDSSRERPARRPVKSPARRPVARRQKKEEKINEGKKRKPCGTCNKGKTSREKRRSSFRLTGRRRRTGVCLIDPLHISIQHHGRRGAIPHRGLGQPKYRYLYQNWVCPCCRKDMCLEELGLFDHPPFRAQRLPGWLRARIALRALELHKREEEEEEYRKGEKYLEDPYGPYYNYYYDSCDQTKQIPCHIKKPYPMSGPCMHIRGFKERDYCSCAMDTSPLAELTDAEWAAYREVMKKLKQKYTGKSLFQLKHRVCRTHATCLSHPVSYESAMRPCPLYPATWTPKKGHAKPPPVGKISTLIPAPYDAIQHTSWSLPYPFRADYKGCAFAPDPCYNAEKGMLCPFCHRRSHDVAPIPPADQPPEIRVKELSINKRNKAPATVSIRTLCTPAGVCHRCCFCKTKLVPITRTWKP